MNKEIEIVEKIKTIYNYNKSSKTISLDSGSGDLYKTLLFKFCFLTDKGSVKFESYKDLWFLQTFEPLKGKLLLEILELFICKIENKMLNFDERIKEIVQSIINLGSYELIKTFQCLQSIYCYYSQKKEIILFPLFYSLAFNKDIKNNLKSDISAIIDSFKGSYYQDQEFFDSIDFQIINLEFLSKINILIYNMKNKMKKDDILPLYQHLCNFSTSSKLNKEYPESFTYFPCLDNIDIEKQIKIKSNNIKDNNINEIKQNKDIEKQIESTRNEIKENNIESSQNKKIEEKVKEKVIINTNIKIDASTNTDSSDDNEKKIIANENRNQNIKNLK